MEQRQKSEQTLEFRMQNDCPHLRTATTLYNEIRRAHKETGSRIKIHFNHGKEDIPSELEFDSQGQITGIGLFLAFSGTPIGKKITFYFSPSVSEDYLSDFRERVEGLFDNSYNAKLEKE